jgi:hypothetical protein
MPRIVRSGRRSQNAWQSFGSQLLGAIQATLGAMATGMFLVLVQKFVLPPYELVYSFAAAVVIGLVTGFYARLIMPKSLKVIQFLAGLTAALIGIVTYGLVLTQTRVSSAFLGLPAWSLPVQVLLSGIVVSLVETAWGKDRLKAIRKRAQTKRAQRVRTTKLRIAAKQGRNRQRKNHPRTTVPHASAVATGSSIHPASSQRAILRTPPRGRRNKAVIKAGFEEHRCPYCLQEVKAGDPRGVKICRVCGAWHHKDCWDITGHCQVPHSGNANP